VPGHARAGRAAGRVVHGERGDGLDVWEVWMRDMDCECGWPREDVSGEKVTWKAAEGVLRCGCGDGRTWVPRTR
jgi:hypothetical protein